jgi:hypothetical protein
MTPNALKMLLEIRIHKTPIIKVFAKKIIKKVFPA